MTLIWRTDLHLADQAPSSRIDDWAETLLGKVAQVGRLAISEDAYGVLDGGDFFHVKSPTRNSHHLVQKAVEAHKDYPCRVIANVGNHDVKYGELRYLAHQPLGVLMSTGIFTPCYDEYEVFFTSDGYFPRVNGAWGAGNPMCGEGFVQGPMVRVVGIPYHGTEYEWERFTRIKKGEEDYLVVMAHVLASPAGGTMFEGEDIIRYEDLKGLEADVICLGHWHKNQGITEIAPGKWVVNIGSMSRGSLSADEVKRTPSVAVLRFRQDGVEIVERSLQVEPPEKVFDLEGRVRRDAHEMSMASFVESFKTALEGTKGLPLEDTIQGMAGTPSEVKERALSYLENRK